MIMIFNNKKIEKIIVFFFKLFVFIFRGGGLFMSGWRILVKWGEVRGVNLGIIEVCY